MRIYECADAHAMSRRAANIISAQVIIKPDCVLGLATGSTPIGAYSQLVEWYRKGDLSFAEVKSVNLDEYLGLAPTHEQSYRYFMQSNLFDHIDIKRENTHVLNGMAADPEAECAAYNELIRSLGGIDLQLLGMGHNGHIAFNEPGDNFGLETHVVTLSERTIDANQRFFTSRDDVPRYALTMGMGNILRAKKLLMIVSGHKEDAMRRLLLSERIDPHCPATFLRLHRDAVVLLERSLADAIGYKA